MTEEDQAAPYEEPPPEVVTFAAPPYPPRPPFDPATNYWKIGNETQVYKAADNIRVQTSDSGYQSWLAAGNTPTPVATEADLWVVMRTHLPDKYPEWLFNGTTFIQPAVNNYTRDQLNAYAANKRWETETGGLWFSPRGGPSYGLRLRIITTRESQSSIDAAALAAERYGEFLTNWKTADGAFHQMDGPSVILMSGSVQWHVKRCFDAEQKCGTYTTLALIDQEFEMVTLIEYPDAEQP